MHRSSPVCAGHLRFSVPCHKVQNKWLAGGWGRPDFVIDSTFDLFVDLGANDEQCDFPVVYASGANGVAGGSPEELAEDLAPLFEAIVREARPLHPPRMLEFWHGRVR